VNSGSTNAQRQDDCRKWRHLNRCDLDMRQKTRISYSTRSPGFAAKPTTIANDATFLHSKPLSRNGNGWQQAHPLRTGQGNYDPSRAFAVVIIFSIAAASKHLAFLMLIKSPHKPLIKPLQGNIVTRSQKIYKTPDPLSHPSGGEFRKAGIIQRCQISLQIRMLLGGDRSENLPQDQRTTTDGVGVRLRD